MWTFLLNTILKRAIPLPILWGSLYPTLTGTVVARNLVLYHPVVQNSELEKDHPDGIPVATVRYAWADPKWSTARMKIVELETVSLEGFSAFIDLKRPESFLSCLQNKKCLSPRQYSRLARLATGKPKTRRNTDSSEDEGDEKKEQLRELIIKAHKVSFTTGEVFLQSGKEQFVLQVVKGESGPIQLPVKDTQFEIKADAFLTHLPSLTAYPIRLLINWNGATEEMSIVLSLKNLPLSFLDSMFPEVKDRVRLLSSASQVEGTISGQLSLLLSQAAEQSETQVGRTWVIR